MTWQDHIPPDLQALYEIHDYKHAAAILASEFGSEFAEICSALLQFRIRPEDILTGGGNESNIPKRMSSLLRGIDWKEGKLTARMLVDDHEIRHDTHKVDYLKGRVAFDLEWNSKDQTFDRDLFAFRAFHEFDRVSVGVLVTRSNELDPWFKSLGKEIAQKYGASTTHMGKLLPRLDAGRSGGCPVLVFGITTALLENTND